VVHTDSPRVHNLCNLLPLDIFCEPPCSVVSFSRKSIVSVNSILISKQHSQNLSITGNFKHHKTLATLRPHANLLFDTPYFWPCRFNGIDGINGIDGNWSVTDTTWFPSVSVGVILRGIPFGEIPDWLKVFTRDGRTNSHMQFPPGRSKRCTRIFNYESTSGITSDLTLTVSFVLNMPRWPLLRGVVSRNVWKRNVMFNFHRFALGDAGGLIDIRVCDLCNHVGFTDVGAPRGCWRLFELKKSR
jgi:hypothetical protein